MNFLMTSKFKCLYDLRYLEVKRQTKDWRKLTEKYISKLCKELQIKGEKTLAE